MRLTTLPAVPSGPRSHWMLWLCMSVLCLAGATSRARAQVATMIPQAISDRPSSSVQLPVIREKLENGLRIVMSPDTTVPTVAVVVYYGASILVLGNTPGIALFSQSVNGRAPRFLKSPASLLKAVASAIRQASARLGEVSSR